MKKKIYRIVFFLIALGVLALIFFYVKDVIVKVMKCAEDKDKEGIEQIISDQGPFGFLAIILIEALQMVVVFIPAEFIQLAAGLSFPPFIAILLCDLGIFIGATVIYLLVNLLKFDRDFFKNSTSKIDNLVRENRHFGTQAIMYLLFIMPAIPFGAICYYGSSTKISYGRYILTCTTGVIPSILSSILLGKAMIWFTEEGAPVWMGVLVVFVLMILLFLTLMAIMKKFMYSGGGEGSPNSRLYPLLLRLFRFFTKIKFDVSIDKEGLDAKDEQIFIVSNHVSHYDMYYLAELIYPRRAAIIGNRYLFRNRMIKKVSEKIGVIPKKLFYPDLEMIKATIKTVREKNSVIMFPEGRLSLDGTSYPIVRGTGALIKKLNLPLVIAVINGGYLLDSKWRKKSFGGKGNVGIRRVIHPDEYADFSGKELDDIIDKEISSNDFAYAEKNKLIYRQKKKAEGLENILFICPACREEFTLETKNNTVYCSACHRKWEINNNYGFTPNPEGIADIHEFYETIKEIQRKRIREESFTEKGIETHVRVTRISLVKKKYDRKGSGICRLTDKIFSFDGLIDEPFSFTLPLKTLKVLAFSAGEEFECYYNDELYYFYPDNPAECVKWAMIVDICAENFTEKANSESNAGGNAKKRYEQ